MDYFFLKDHDKSLNWVVTYDIWKLKSFLLHTINLHQSGWTSRCASATNSTPLRFLRIGHLLKDKNSSINQLIYGYVISKCLTTYIPHL